MKIPFFAACARGHGEIPICRTNIKKAIDALTDAANLAKDQKKNIIISPEGTRRRTKSIGGAEQMLPFKKGPFHLAKNSGSSITPLVFIGAHRVSVMGGAFFKRGKVFAKYQETIPARVVQEKSIEELIEIVRDRMAKASVKTRDEEILG